MADNKKGYVIYASQKLIELDASFTDKAEQDIESKEAKILSQLVSVYPTFEIKRKKRVSSNSKITKKFILDKVNEACTDEQKAEINKIVAGMKSIKDPETKTTIVKAEYSFFDLKTQFLKYFPEFTEKK